MKKSRKLVWIVAAAAGGAPLFMAVKSWHDRREPHAAALGSHVVMGYNELGMHCMNQDFSEMCILPPYNVLRAQVIKRGEEPTIVTSGVNLKYALPSNTHSADKTNFWEYDKALFGAAFPPDIGLTGNGLAGSMSLNSARKDWEATGIPVTPIDDNGLENPYPLATVTVFNSGGAALARTQAVVPVSWEISCNLCHNTPGVSTATDILQKHDAHEGTHLVDQKPVLCASCHADNALGTPGQPGVKNLSRAMHGFHADKMAALGLPVDCYACHPGMRTQCQRDVHLEHGMTCGDCHGTMANVADPGRNPWVTEPRCGNCHNVAGHQYEQSNTLYKFSKGHSGVQCMTCHGSPHAITPTTTDVDNAQAINLQGHAGAIDSCIVCHSSPPDEPFFHKVSD